MLSSPHFLRAALTCVRMDGGGNETRVKRGEIESRKRGERSKEMVRVEREDRMETERGEMNKEGNETGVG